MRDLTISLEALRHGYGEMIYSGYSPANEGFIGNIFSTIGKIIAAIYNVTIGALLGGGGVSVTKKKLENLNDNINKGINRFADSPDLTPEVRDVLTKIVMNLSSGLITYSRVISKTTLEISTVSRSILLTSIKTLEKVYAEDLKVIERLIKEAEA